MNYIFTPAADNILVRPLKRKWKTMKTPAPDVEKWKEEHDGQNPTMEDELETKMVKTRYLLEFQLAEVVDINPKLKPLIDYKVGDVVVYDMKPAKEFNLIKGTELIRSFNIYGKWDEKIMDSALLGMKDPNVLRKGDEKPSPRKEIPLPQDGGPEYIEDDVAYDDAIPAEHALAKDV